MFVFFKQKTAYEMRISDWSSDVCSSDLRDQPVLPARQDAEELGPGRAGQARVRGIDRRDEACRHARRTDPVPRRTAELPGAGQAEDRREPQGGPRVRPGAGAGGDPAAQGRDRALRAGRRFRSEEHTSELQSLMRNSYAVLCLKTKKLYNKKQMNKRHKQVTR